MKVQHPGAAINELRIEMCRGTIGMVGRFYIIAEPYPICVMMAWLELDGAQSGLINLLGRHDILHN